MSVTVANLSGGAAFVSFNSKNIQFESDCSLEMVPTTAVLSSALYGKFDEIPTDLVIKFSGTPRYYDTAAIATMFPYTGAFPAVGAFYGGGNVAASINSINGDQFILNNAMVGKMSGADPRGGEGDSGADGNLGVDPVRARNATNAGAYYTYNAAGGSYSFAYPSGSGHGAGWAARIYGSFWLCVRPGEFSGAGDVDHRARAGMVAGADPGPDARVSIAELPRAGPMQARRRHHGRTAHRPGIARAPTPQPGTRLSQLAKAANGGASFPSLAISGDEQHQRDAGQRRA